MDTLSHGLYGGVAFGRNSKRDYAIAFLFGIAPDILSFGILFLFMFLGLESFPATKFEPPDSSQIPQFVHTLYDITHSLVVYGIFFGALWAAGKKHFAKLTLGWPLHILVDMPTHAASFFPTPFLWPISDFSIDGIPWSNPFIFIPNVVILIGLYTHWYWKRKKSREFFTTKM